MLLVCFNRITGLNSLSSFQHGVGNWKLILEDPRFEFQDRSPVDLKDRYEVF